MTITKNTLVTLEYTLGTSDGQMLDTHEELIYLHGGYGQLFEKVELELAGKSVGDRIRIDLSPEEAFGPYDGSLLVEESLHELPLGLEAGMEIEGHDEDKPDDVTIYTVKEIRGEEAVLDGNHPLAGIALVFEAAVTDLELLPDEGIAAYLDHEASHTH